MMQKHRITPPGNVRRHRARGVGLVETMLLTLMLGGAMIAGAAWLKARMDSSRAEDQVRLLQQADHQVRGFFAARNRLPCPATPASHGEEDCSGAGQKGLLPYRTLGMDAAAERGGYAQLAYVVYRSAAIDLAAAGNVFEPSKWDGPATGAAHDFGTIGSPDFCRALTRAAAESSGAAARVYSGGTGRSVAYAIAHGGATDADGNGSVFDGRNVGALAEMEVPERGVTPGAYDDRVIARNFVELALVADCPRLMASLDGAALAVDVIDEVNSQKIFTTATASILTAVNVVKGVIQTVKTVKAAMATAAAATVLGTATTALTAAIASCVVIVGCAEIPHAAASVAAAAVAVAAGATAVAANVVAVTGIVAATALTATVAIKAGITVGQSSINLADAVAKAEAGSIDAQAKAVTAREQLDKAKAGAASSDTAQADAWNALIAQAHSVVNSANEAGKPKGTMALSAKDHLLDDVKARSKALFDAQYAVTKAEDALKTAKEVPQDSGTGTSTESQSLIDALQSQIDQESAKSPPDQAKIDALKKTLADLKAQASGTNTVAQQISVLQARIADLQTQLAAERAKTSPDNAKIAQLESNISSLQNQLASLDTGVAGKQAALDLARQQAAAAKTQYDSSRQAAIDAFRIQYCVTKSTTSGDPPKTTTTTDCNNYYDGRSDITGKIDDFHKKHQAWLVQGEGVKAAQSYYDQASAAANQARNSYETLKAVATGKEPASALALTNWMGAEAILRAADAKGGTR